MFSKLSPGRPSVIVVGGGVSGLAAATHLIKNGGFDVTLLEAAERVGGRVHSVKTGDYVVEHGAQWVHGEIGNSIFGLANPFGLLNANTEKFGSESEFVTQRGEFLGELVVKEVEDFLEKLDLSNESVRETFDPNETFGDFVIRTFGEHNLEHWIHESQNVRDGILDWIHRLQNNIEGTDNWFQQSCQGHLDYKHCEGISTIPYKASACYNSIIGVILNGEPTFEDRTTHKIQEWIHLNKRVTRIKYSITDDKIPVSIRCTDGSEFTSDHVICTVSLGVLKAELSSFFEPNLPKGKMSAIENLGFGTVNKIFLQFVSPWWPTGCQGFNLVWDDCKSVIDYQRDISEQQLMEEVDGIPIWCRGLLGFYALDSHPNVLKTWAMGAYARLIEKFEPRDLQGPLNAVLQKFLGHTYKIPSDFKVTRTAWHTNPLTRGSYSYQSIESQKNSSPNQLGLPLTNSGNGKPVICFAGEATHPHYFSTVHGAYDSGIREAKRLINYY